MQDTPNTTRLLSAGTDIKTVYALLGDTVATVINTYVSYTDDMREEAKEDIERLKKYPEGKILRVFLRSRDYF